jgi:hypothetical protein
MLTRFRVAGVVAGGSSSTCAKEVLVEDCRTWNLALLSPLAFGSRRTHDRQTQARTLKILQPYIWLSSIATVQPKPDLA